MVSCLPKGFRKRSISSLYPLFGDFSRAVFIALCCGHWWCRCLLAMTTIVCPLSWHPFDDLPVLSLYPSGNVLQYLYIIPHPSELQPCDCCRNIVQTTTPPPPSPREPRRAVVPGREVFTECLSTASICRLSRVQIRISTNRPSVHISTYKIPSRSLPCRRSTRLTSSAKCTNKCQPIFRV